ncbi:MAG TPA: ATP-binding protein [Gammaproteobacteria bacterium]|nr:ATP-binding protein [Gammaproteobacteria bacterium]
MKNNVALKRKIKALEEENNFLKQIISRLPGNIYWKNKQGFYMGCNKNAAKLVNLNSEADIVGKTIYDLVGPQFAELGKEIDKTDKRIMQAKKEVTLEEIGFDSHRKPATYLSIKAPLFDQTQKVSGLVCASMDISRIKEAERILREAKNKAEETSRLKSELVNIVEHDIRAPFCGIHAMSSLLARQETDPDKKEALESIANSSKASLDYATRLLSFAKIEEEYSEVQFKVFSVTALIQSVVAIELPFAQAKGLELLTAISWQIPEKVISCPDRLKGILINLISNALKFTSQGYVKINADFIKKKGLQCYLEFSVEDTGIGLPPGKQHFINENFFRANSTSQGLLPGFGLGLPVVKKFVSDLKGEIEIKSKEGKGTVIIFTIPIENRD